MIHRGGESSPINWCSTPKDQLALPDTTVAVPVPDVTEVDCSSDTAHYKVIQDFPDTTDMTRCEDNPDTQYEFSAELTDGYGGLPVVRYVYCLIGLGDRAR